MSTLHLTAPPTLKRRTRLTTAIATLAVLAAIATAAIILASRSTNATHAAPSVASANDTSAAYAPPHVPVKIRTSSQAPAVGITANNQDSPAYTKAELYTKVR
jgi:hypothetical protein